MKNKKIYTYTKSANANSDAEICASVGEFLREFSDTAPDGFSVIRDKNGKPYIVGIDGIYVSVAHDKELCLVVVSQSEIGIDLERAERRVKNPLALARRYFCEDEIAFLGDSPTDAAFADMWVRKEALSKLIGRGVPCMKEKSVFSSDIRMEKIGDFDGYIVYTAEYSE